MKLWACAQPETIIDGAKDPDWLAMMHRCRLHGFLLICFDVTEEIPLDVIVRAVNILRSEGFDVIGIGLPLGHPEGLDTPHFTFHEGWHIRRDIDGREVRWCNAVTPRLIADIRRQVEKLKSVGIDKIFWDDDLRQGNHEGDVQGCFCDSCLGEFSGVFDRPVTRDDLRPVLSKDPGGLSAEQLLLREKWMDFTCARITRFMKETTVPGVQNGIMVMHNGDRRHGIDIAAIREAVPDCLFRVGELMFDDESFEKPENRRSLVRSILRHKALMGDPANIFSESTVYPHGALTPENLRKKIILERRCGLENICLMGVERMNSPAYYRMLAENYDFFASIKPDIIDPDLAEV
ncbi:MAG: hypothetical protein IKM31_02700 [Oscillospiraceae bacterium]|nr:hypothetical protein [Oscillospiraceae bacterium]